MEKDNILLAEFLGMQKTELGWYDAEDKLYYACGRGDNTFDSLPFHKDWNWLMSVVGFINELEVTEHASYWAKEDGVVFEEDLTDVCYLVKPEGKFCGVYEWSSCFGEMDIINASGETEQDAIYNVCVAFVAWYKD